MLSDINSKLNTVNERITELKNRSTESIQDGKKNRKKRMTKK